MNLSAGFTANLKKLGFDAWEDYITSDTWKSIKAKVLARDKKTCRRCQKPARYVCPTSIALDVLSGGMLGPVLSFCKDCHSEALESLNASESTNKGEEFWKNHPAVQNRGSKPWIGFSYKAKALARKKQEAIDKKVVELRLKRRKQENAGKSEEEKKQARQPHVEGILKLNKLKNQSSPPSKEISLFD